MLVCFRDLSNNIRWWSGKESACQGRRCKRHVFDSWVGKMPWFRNDNLLQYSYLETSMDGGAWRATVHVVAKSQTWPSTQHTHTHTHVTTSSYLNTGKLFPWMEINSWLAELVLCFQSHAGKKTRKLPCQWYTVHHRGCFWEGKQNGQWGVNDFTFHVFLDF